MILRVTKVLVGEGDFAFVHAFGEDGAEWKMELPANLGRTLKKGSFLQVDVKPVVVPVEPPDTPTNAVISAGKSGLAQRGLGLSASTSGLGTGKSASLKDSSGVTDSGAGATASGEIPSSTPQRDAARPFRRMTSPDPRKHTPAAQDPLRRMLFGGGS